MRAPGSWIGLVCQPRTPQERDTPRAAPTPSVTPAALQPKTACRAGENHALRPLKSEVSIPIAHNAAALAMMLAPMAHAPCNHMNETIGKTAPRENNAKDVAAALTEFPPSSARSLHSKRLTPLPLCTLSIACILCREAADGCPIERVPAMSEEPQKTIMQ
jgi:hypothetical protein